MDKRGELQWTGEEVSAAAAWESLRFWRAAAAAAEAAAGSRITSTRRQEHQQAAAYQGQLRRAPIGSTSSILGSTRC